MVKLANVRITLTNGDFIKEGLRLLRDGKHFSHIIMNPPYFKMRRNSHESDFLLSCGINVTNIYAAFMWLGILLLEDGGQLVAIVPRSFCNDPYFLRFREFVAASASIETIHTFGSRDKVFSKDSVLQENVIIRFAKKPQSKHLISTSLALLDLKPDDEWTNSTSSLIGITPIMDWSRENYGRGYAPNTRETFRRQSMHQFVEAGIALYNPDEPDRPINSPLPSRTLMTRFLSDIAWETEVWISETPSHLIHFNGDKFLGPYE